MGLDYNQLNDFELFILLAPTLSLESTSILFGDLNFTKLKCYRNPENGEIILADKESNVKIDRLIYELITNYLRKVHGLKKKIEHAANEMTRQILIDEDRQQIKLNKDKPYKSFLLPLISSVKVRMGYTKDYIRNMGIVEFMDDVNRLEIIHNADALLQGCYAGTIDMSKIQKKELNWMRELDKE